MKKVNLKNYTSSVPAITSMGRIESVLVAAGATDISKKYEDGICTAITFRMVESGRPLFFKLPAKVENCFQVFWKEIKKPQAGTKEKIREQAERTAWKIVSDWVEVQLSMILLEQALPLQVFLPYVYDPVKDQTFFERLESQNFKLLTV